MGYAFIDTAGLRDRRSKRELAATEIRTVRDQASTVLSAVGHGRSNLAGLTDAVSVADFWTDRITSCVADAELGPGWRVIGRLVATVSDGFTALRSSGAAVAVNGPDLPFTSP